MQLEQHWAETTAKRVRAETRHVGYRAEAVKSQAHHARRTGGADERANVRTVAAVSLADILGAGFTPGRRVG